VGSQEVKQGENMNHKLDTDHWEKFRDHPDAWNAAGSIAEQVRRASSAFAEKGLL